MLDLQQILAYYSVWLQNNSEHILREYLQYKILKSIFASKRGSKLRFIGWTALRIVYGNARFSEDIDFDNDGTITFEEFDLLGQHIQKDLELQGLTIRMRTIEKWAFHCNISIPELLYDNKLAPMRNQTILIQIDTAAQWYIYTPTVHYLNKFDVQTDILTITPALLLAQKIYTVFERKRIKWRDFFDIVFLLWLTQQPDYWYLNQKIWINKPSQVKEYLLDKSQWLDFQALQRDVQPFLFDSNNQSVTLFPRIIEQTVFY
jgi:predicted nucleotidyltransferase component of viral defense system